MAKPQVSLKQLAINKDNSTIMLVVGIASFVVVFSLIASNALLKQSSYQSRVISKKKVALKQLKTNAQEVDKLKDSYQKFASQQTNVLGGSSTGAGEKDGENPRLVLDALPSKYDFPGLTTSLEKVFRQYNIKSITGTDDEITQSQSEDTGLAQTVEMPFTITVGSTPQTYKDILQTFEKSIRPFQVKKIAITGDAGEVKLTVDGLTYYQPQKKFNVKEELVR